MIIYADVLFFMNVLMNYMVISVCAAISPKSIKISRRILASVVGGVYGLLVFAADFRLMHSLVMSVLAAAIIVIIGVFPCGLKDYLKNVVVFYISSFLLSGGIFMVLPYIGGGVVRNNVVYHNSVEIIAVAGMLTIVAVKGIKHIKIHCQKCGYRVKLKYKENVAEVEGIFDTGNMLSDPMGGNAVIVGDETVLKPLFSVQCNILNLNEWIDCRDIRLIPYKTLDKDGVMTGIRLDEVCIGGKVIKNVTLAISPKRIEHGILINSGIL